MEELMKTGAPDVSVVVPIWNSALWLEQCLDSVLAQTKVNVEIICVDDGSADESRSIILNMAARDPRIIPVSIAHSGLSIVRNKGLDLAKGRYIAFLDSDDYWREDRLEEMVGRADSDRLDVLIFNLMAVKDDDDLLDEAFMRYVRFYSRSGSYQGVKSGVEMLRDLREKGDYYPSACQYLVNREYLQSMNLGFIPGIIHEDNPFTFRLLLEAQRVALYSFALYARRVRGGSIMTTRSEWESARGYTLGLAQMLRTVQQVDLPEDSFGAVVSILKGVAHNAVSAISKLNESDRRRLVDSIYSIDEKFIADQLIRQVRAPRS